MKMRRHSFGILTKYYETNDGTRRLYSSKIITFLPTTPCCVRLNRKQKRGSSETTFERSLNSFY